MTLYIGRPLIGCASHKLNLAIQSATAFLSAIFKKINIFMKELSTLKNSAILRNLTNLRPVQQQETRWSGTFNMLQRYLSLHDIVFSAPTFSSMFKTKYLLTPDELQLVRSAFEGLSALNQLAIDLQSGDFMKTRLSVIRCVFDDLVVKYPTMKKHLAQDASIVTSPPFERAVIKIECGLEKSLALEEKRSVEHLRRKEQPHDENSIARPARDDLLASAQYQVDNNKRQLTMEQCSAYRNVLHVASTSNICERLFSRAGYIFSDYRRKMNPRNLELLLYLHNHRALWNVYTINSCSSIQDHRSTDLGRGMVDITAAMTDVVMTNHDDFFDDYA